MDSTPKLDSITENAVMNLLANSNPIEPGKQGFLGTPMIPKKTEGSKPDTKAKHGADGKTVSSITSMLGGVPKKNDKLVENGGTYTWIENTINSALVSAGIPEENWSGVKDTVYTLLMAGRLGDGTVSDMTAEAIAKIVNELSGKASTEISPIAKPLSRSPINAEAPVMPDVIPGEEVGTPDVDFEMPDSDEDDVKDLEFEPDSRPGKDISDDEGAFETQNFVEPTEDDEFSPQDISDEEDSEEPEIDTPEDDVSDGLPMELPSDEELKGFDLDDLEDPTEDLDGIIDKLDAGEFDDDKSDDKKEDEDEEDDDEKEDDKKDDKKSKKESVELNELKIADKYKDVGTGDSTLKCAICGKLIIMGGPYADSYEVLYDGNYIAHSSCIKAEKEKIPYGGKRWGESLTERNRDGTGPEGKGPLTGRGSCGGKGTLAQRRKRLKKRQWFKGVKGESISPEMDELIEQVIDEVMKEQEK